MSPKRALITGITGQDGSYLAELLLQKGYEVIGMLRRSSTLNFERIRHIQDRLILASGDLLDQASMLDVLHTYHPDEVYNLAAQSFVQSSWNSPVFTGDVTGLGVTRLLDSIRLVDPAIRFYQASTSEMFGKVTSWPQNEQTPFHPRSPYGVAKMYGHWITINFRESYNMFAVSGICYNHESPRRGLEFVPRKICRAAARIKLGKDTHVALGNLDAERDWGFAPDYVRGMWLMLQQDHPEDFVLATGKLHTVRDLCRLAFEVVGLDYQDYVRTDARFMRPADEIRLVGDPSKAKTLMGWEAATPFEEMVRILVEAELRQEQPL
jgi:GDPmannose 4,6-dehydratase